MNDTVTTETYWVLDGEPLRYSETWVQCDTCLNVEPKPHFGEGLWALVARSAAVPPRSTRIDKDEYDRLVEQRDQRFMERAASRTATEMKVGE